ncbi:hypothetical protein M9H77_12660 [Catharanthus roseus]|uniref:Uncharacterized protein n=1 Tax=Catharanthus roseus TaxID=4058 RepID=A0ACC0BI80_CATRO|nr:hypothetical protein M9H77_12660 [Catharanthus roseus]
MVDLLRRTFKITRGRHSKGENEYQKSTKTFQMSIMQVEKAKGTSLEDLEDSTSNGEERMNPTAGSRVHLLSTVGSWYRSSHDYSDQNCGREVNHEGLIGENDFFQEKVREMSAQKKKREFSPICLHHNINARKETYHGVRRPKRKCWGKLFICYGDSSMSFSSNLFLCYLVFSFKELKLFLDGYDFLVFSLACSTFYSRYISYSCYEIVKFLLCDVIGQRDHSLFVHVLHQFQGEVVEHLQYVLTSLDPHVMGFDEHNLVEKPLLLVKSLIVKSCQRHHKRKYGICGIRLVLRRCSTNLMHFFAFSLLILESFGNVHNIASFNASMSNVAHLLWLFEGRDLITNPFKKRRYGMTRDKHKNIKIFQGSATRLGARKPEKENEEIVDLLGSTFDYTSKVLEMRNEDQRSTKTFQMSIMQVEKAKGTRLDDLEDSTSNGEE